jgi:anti-sigma factor RsiW
MLALYVEGDLTEEERRPIEAHLSECQVCRGFLDGLRKSQGALKALAEPAIPSTVFEEVRRRVSAEIDGAAETAGPGTQFPFPLRPAYRWALAAGLLMAFLAAAVFLLIRGTTPSPKVAPAGGTMVSAPPAPAPQTPEAPRAPKAPESPALPVLAKAPEGLPAARRLETSPTNSGELALYLLSAPLEQEPQVIRLQTEDPEVVIYWFVEDEGGRT